ncbi:MAG: hypothetical protein JOY94_17855 [Methylobacteriaceae bacterium]|nr:hypothetical protein [Methylobacteriaceae bacterium]
MGHLASRRGPPPGFIVPCQPELRKQPPHGSGWIHEIKYGGHRLIACESPSGPCLWTRSAIECTGRFNRISRGLAGLQAVSLTLDGEAVVLRDNGQADSYRLRSREGAAEAVMVAFDILTLNGEDLRSRPIEDRRTLLGELLAAASDDIVLAEAFAREGAVVLEHVCALGLQGTVSKRLGSPYTSGPSGDWIEARCRAARAPF